MPRRSFLSQREREELLATPTEESDLIRRYALSQSDIKIINQRRGAENRLGFAVQLCYMRYPGIVLGSNDVPATPVVGSIAQQLGIDPGVWSEYGQRDQTRREHLVELRSVFGFTPFTTASHYRPTVRSLETVAWHTDKGSVLANTLVESLRQQSVLLPPANVIDRMCAEAITHVHRRLCLLLTEPLSEDQRAHIDALLELRENSTLSVLAWLRQSPRASTPRHLLEHLDRLAVIETLTLPDGIERLVPQNWLVKSAREGGQMTAQHLRDLENTRRYATLVAVLTETRATIIDETITIHDHIIGNLFNRAKQHHEQVFLRSGKAFNDKVLLYGRIGRAVLEADQAGSDFRAAIESVIPWDAFTESVDEAEKLAQPADFDHLDRIGEGYGQIRRYAPDFLEALHWKAAPAVGDLLDAIDVLKQLNSSNARNVPNTAPIGFVRKRWHHLVFTPDGINRRFYELCVLSELRNALRSGDIWVRGSRQFKDFDDYLLPISTFTELKQQHTLPVAVETNGETYLTDRLALLHNQLMTVDHLSKTNQLPDATITDAGLKISPLKNSVPPEADPVMQRIYGLMPHIKITELLLEVNSWTGFAGHFTHLKSGEAPPDTPLLLTAVLADAVNIGLSKMAEAAPDATYAKLAQIHGWHIRDETYAQALAELVNAQSRQSFAAYWGEGTTSSSDGQRFKAGSFAQAQGNINPKYGSDRGVLFYTHISDQYAPFHTNVISVGVRDATYVLDGLLYHDSDLKIEEHYTDTAGFTDHVFALMHLLGFRFAPRIRDLADKRLYVDDGKMKYPTLAPLIGGAINVSVIRSHWDEILRLASSIQRGTVTASLMLRKLGSYPRQNGLAFALRELGRIERTLFALEWLQSPELRRRVQAGLNKGESRNALSRAVFFNRLGEVRDRSFENQSYRASGLNLVCAAIILWNTVYLQRAVHALNKHGQPIPENLLQYLSPLGWEHINLTGDYIWPKNSPEATIAFRSLRSFPIP